LGHLLLCDISRHLNNTELQGQQKLISDTFCAVRVVEMKLKLFRKQMKNVNLCHFPSCDLLHKDGSVNVPFPSVCAVEMTDYLAENFKVNSTTFVAMLKIHVRLKTHSLLKSAKLQQNCNLIG
jgi:hypothetical protein